MKMQMVLPDYATRFDSLSLSACFLDLKGVGETPRQATGFFWRHSGKVFLITNWHVVTGRNMMDGGTIGQGWTPETLTVQYFTTGRLFSGRDNSVYWSACAARLTHERIGYVGNLPPMPGVFPHQK